MNKFAQSLLGLWKQLGINQRVSLAVATVAVIGGLAAIAAWSRRPDFQLLYAQLGVKDAGAVVAYLDAQGVPYQVTAGGTAIEVPSDRVYKLRMELAAKDLPSGDGVGFEIFDKGQFGLSDFVQRTNYLRAIQGELGRTISQLQGVRAARVMIVQPENRLLVTDESIKSTASVFVDLGGGRLELDQVNAIRHLVANAVQGLLPDQVAVVDNHGHVLSEELRQDPSLGSASSQMQYRQQVEDYLSRKVESMLAEVIGPGNAVVRVSADIETDATTRTEEKYDPDGQVVRSQTTSDDTSNSVETHSGGGAVGISSNVPDKAAAETPQAHPTTSTEQARKNRSTTYEINRTLTNTTRSPGTIRNITAAVLIATRNSGGEGGAVRRTPEELNALRQIVVNALGLKGAAGESPGQVTVEEMPFAVEPISQQAQSMQNEGKWVSWLDNARRWSAIAGAAAVFLVFLRLLSRQKPEPVPVEILTLPPDVAARSLPNGAGGITPEMVNALIRQKPANIGAALRDWVGSNHN